MRRQQREERVDAKIRQRDRGIEAATAFAASASPQRRYQSVESYMAEWPGLTTDDFLRHSVERLEEGLCLYQEHKRLPTEQADAMTAKHGVLSSLWILAQEWAWNLRPSEVMRADLAAMREDITLFRLSDEDREVFASDDYPHWRADLERELAELNELTRLSLDLANVVERTIEHFENGHWADTADVRRAAIETSSLRVQEYRKMREHLGQLNPRGCRLLGLMPEPQGMYEQTRLEM